MTRGDAPALVITTQCEIYGKGDHENSTVTASIKDLQMRASSFLPDKRKDKIATVSLLFTYLVINYNIHLKKLSGDLLRLSLFI